MKNKVPKTNEAPEGASLELLGYKSKNIITELANHKVHYYLEMQGHKVCAKCYALKYSKTALSIMKKENEDFISQVEKDAIERTRKECEDLHKNDSTPEEIRELMENVEKQAIEKTNKRWERRLEEAKSVAVQVARSFIIDREVGIPPQNPLNEDLYVKYLNGEIDAKLSDLLEDKK